VTPLLDACYAPTRDDQRWAADVMATFRQAFRCFDEVGLYVISCDPVADSMTPLVVAVPPQWRPMVDGVRTAALHGSQNVLYGRDVLSSMAWARPRMTPAARAHWNTCAINCGIDDGVGLVVHPTPTTALLVFGSGASGMLRERKARMALTRIALHLESGFRMRVQPGAVRAVLRADGRLIDGELTEREHERYASATRGAEATRDTRDLEFWTALVAGHVSVVPRMRGTQRVYELVENARAWRHVRALTRREVDVLELASTGLSNKLCGYALGLSPAAISMALTNAAQKLGALSQLELLRVAALLARDPRADANEATLTAAEREILALLRQGLSNADIAAQRGRSVRTIANQVASLLEKTGQPSRRALIARSDRSLANATPR
jgi:DNA-binding CsgD family transcriptional regulator